MQELFNVALHPLNIVYTLLLALVILYWLSVIVGALDLGSIDVDADFDAGFDGDFSFGGWLAGALHFFHFDRLPFMLIMSLVITSAWSMALLSNHYWGKYDTTFALFLTGPIVLIAFIVAKLLSYPLIPLFKATNTAAVAVEYIGQICRVKLPPSGDQFGQAGVEYDGDELLVNIKSAAADRTWRSGQTAVIIGRSEDHRYWLIEPVESEGF